MEEAQRSRDHPRAADIYARVKEKMPNISFGTVYGNLRSLKENNLVRELNRGDRTARYDGNMAEHHHAVCVSCGDIVDVDLPPSQLDDAGALGTGEDGVQSR